MRTLLTSLAVLVLAFACGKPTKPPADAAPPPPPVADAAPPGTCPTPAQLASDLSAAAQAAVIGLAGVNPINCPEVGMTQTWGGGKLIFSDSPEHPTTRGKLYEDTTLEATEGTAYNRIFLYHTNGSSTLRLKFVPMLKNTGSATGALVVQKKGTAGPTTSYAYAGKLGFSRWLNAVPEAQIDVPAGQWVQIDTVFDSIDTAQNYLMHGIWDYSFTQPHTITICALEKGDVPATTCPVAQVLARDTHQRGTFPFADKVYDTAAPIALAGGIQSLPIAGNTENDSDAMGVDKTDGTEMRLQGNYGVLYKIHLGVEFGGKKAGFLLNPRGGSWGGAVWAASGLLLGGKFLIPDGSGTFTDNTKGAVEGKYESGAPWLQFMPTGGSSLPVRLVAVPY